VLADGQVVLGKVGVGVTVRKDAPAPNIASTDDLKATLLAADTLVYNTASTGLYLERLFERLGIAEQLKPKTTRHANGEAVMLHVINGTGRQIGFGAITEIKLFEAKGLRLVGPLPADVQNFTSYGAALMANAPQAEAAKAFITYLATPEAKQAFNAAGIE
jgi:molybdate transport system substrate-binding protein